MKKITNLHGKKILHRAKFIVLVSLLTFGTLLADVPACFNYQAVLRDASGNIKANTNVEIEISILQGGPTGTVVYNETHDTITNENGLVNLLIGIKDSAAFNGISWETGRYFMQVDVDGTTLGTTQLWSVPYAKYANRVEYVDGENINSGTISSDRFSAYSDLNTEGRLDNNNGSDLLTQQQGDLRYNFKTGFFARNNESDSYTTGSLHKVEFDELLFGILSFSTSQDRYTALQDGGYDFSASVQFLGLAAGAKASLLLYVNEELFCNLASNTAGSSGEMILSGSVTIELEGGDHVEIYVESSDPLFSIGGDVDFNVTPTHFSGHLVYLLF